MEYNEYVKYTIEDKEGLLEAERIASLEYKLNKLYNIVIIVLIVIIVVKTTWEYYL